MAADGSLAWFKQVAPVNRKSDDGQRFMTDAGANGLVACCRYAREIKPNYAGFSRTAKKRS